MGLKRCKLKDSVQRKLLEFFVAEVTARTAADLIGIQVNTAALFYRKIRMNIAKQLEAESAEFSGEIELDESYFGDIRKGKRGRGSAGKVPVFGILKRGGKVYTQIIQRADTATLLPIIGRKVRPDSIIYTDGWKGYNALRVSEFKHYRINHSKLFANGRNHINGIENYYPKGTSGIRPSAY